MRLNSISVMLRVGLLMAALPLHGQTGITVFAAASMTDVMGELACAYEAGGGVPVRFSFASSGTLARQIAAGAPADLFVSANPKWMDWLAARSAIEPASRFDLAANRLVLIAPAGSTLAFGDEVPGRVAVGDCRSVPAGIYAREALEAMGKWPAWRGRLVPVAHVRTALMLVERGEVDAGIVYATDAGRSEKVTLVGTFDMALHTPIRYPVALCRGMAEALGFLEFLGTVEAKGIFLRHGFTGGSDG